VAGIAADAVRRIGIRLSALAQDGLTFAADEYDLDRYRQLSRLAAELLSVLSGRPADELAVELGRDSGYATPKIGVRGAISQGVAARARWPTVRLQPADRPVR